MSEEPVIGAESTEERAEPVIGEPPPEPVEVEVVEPDLAGLLRETLLAAHADLSPEDLAGESAEEVRERYVAARARLERESAEARGRHRCPRARPGASPAPPKAPSRRSARGSHAWGTERRGRRRGSAELASARGKR